MKHLLLKISAVVIIPLLLSFGIHDFYTSMTKVDYNLASSTVQFSTKIDVEHVEAAVGAKNNAGNFEGALKGYLTNHFKVKINEASQDIVYANFKVTGEVIWIYYNIPNVKEVKSIEINNTLLFEKYAEQQNFVNFNINNERKSMIAKKGNSSAKVTF